MKKIVSIILSFVLILGVFSVILPEIKVATTTVAAETVEQTFDYKVLLGDKDRGTNIQDTRILNNMPAGIDFLGIFNSLGLAVRYEGSLGISDRFFEGTAIGAERNEIHPYIVYNVVPGTSFTLNGAGYNDATHKSTGCSDSERFFNLYVSNDGVNWIPTDVKKEFTGVWSGAASYDTYSYTIDNVGLKTNFVKVEFPMTVASRRTDTPNMAYYPNESLLVTSVSFAKPETYNANGETLFQAKLFSLQKELYEKYFIAFPEIIANDNSANPSNLANPYHAATISYGIVDKAWGTYEDINSRSFVAMVEPGSRFYLEAANQNYMVNVGKAMVNLGEIPSADLARIRVYTSATLSDNDSDWTEWNPMPYTMHTNANTLQTFNFYLPKDHLYVKIVFPQKGDLRKLTLNGNAATGEVGNTGCFFNDIVFTPYKKGVVTESYDYTVSGTTGYTKQTNLKEYANGLRAETGAYNNLPNGHPSNTNKTPLSKGAFSATYAVSDSRVLSLEYAIRITDSKYGYGKGAYDANAGGEKMGFEISVSNDGTNWYNAYKTQSGYAQTSKAIGTSGIYAYDVNYLIPENAKYVRVDFDLVGNGYIYTNADKTTSDMRYFNDAMYLRKVSFSNAHSADGDVQYALTTDTDAKLGVSSDNDGKDGADLSVSTRNDSGRSYVGYAPGWGYLKQNKAGIAGTIDRAYVTYDIEPGTTFKSEYSLRYQAIAMSEKTAQKNLNDGMAGAKQELVEYAFFLYGRNKNDGTWELFAKSNPAECEVVGDKNNYNTFAFGTFNVRLPDYVDKVKVEFPQTGGFYTDTTNWKNVACGNDGAFLFNVQFVAPGTPAQLGEGVHYNLLESSNIASADKKDLSIYHLGGVSIVKGDGVKANGNNAFVIYKIKEGTMLALRSNDNLSFEYSTDDITYTAVDFVKAGNAYKLPAIGERTYIKVKLDNGEAIRMANAEIAVPTAKFYVPYLNKYQLIDYADYGATANSVAPTLDMLRPGYTFTGWSGLNEEQVYVDTVFEATFVKTNELVYTVSYTVNGQTQTKTDVKFDDRVTISAPRESDGKVFVKWVDGKRTTVSDNPTFSFLASGNVDLTAVYAESKEAIDPYIYATADPVITTNANGTWNMSIVWRTAVPKDVTVKETGILLGTDVDKAQLVLSRGLVQSGTVKLVHNSTEANKTLMYTVKNIKADKVRSAVPYAKLSNGKIIYGENVIKVKSGVKMDSAFEFYGSISPEVLSNYLDRSLTYSAFDSVETINRNMAVENTKDVISQSGAKYFARALCHWMPSIGDVNSFEFYRDAIAQVHQVDPEVVMEACIFETCWEGMNQIPIPAWVFEAFGLPVEERNFDYTKMAHQNGWLANNWGEGRHVPSISTLEFQMFTYYRACCYIDMGIEAIHFGQMNLVGAINSNANNVDNASWTKVLDMIRAYAKENARRGYIIVDGHYPNQNLTRSDDSSTMLVDYNMFPFRLQTIGTDHAATETNPQVCGLNTNANSDAPYSTSRQANVKNKKSPSGYTYDSYPYVLEFDNWGTNEAGLDKAGSYWGYDEISWYVNQPKWYRHQYLIEIALEVKNLASAPNGHVCMPGRRTAYISRTGCSEYRENDYFLKNAGEKGIQHPLWDIAIAGDVVALKAAWTAIGSFGTKYDYSQLGENNEGISNSNKYEYGISALGGIGLINNEVSGNTVFRGLHPSYGALGADWNDATEAPYVIYKVKPGTVIDVDLYMYQAGKKSFENAGHDFDFKIECSSSTTGGWKNAVTTDSYTTTNINVLYNVPTDCSYVKITFPQKGKLSTGSRGNDFARLMAVRFVSE